MMRISTTTLEAFRLFMLPEQEWMPESELLDTIAGRFTGNHFTAVGLAYGRILETPDRYRIPGGYNVDGIVLGDDCMQPGLELIDRPRTVFEAKAVGVIGGQQIVAKADQMIGARLIETKAKLGTFDFDNYAASCQWRCMSILFDVPAIEYRVQVLAESEANGVISPRGLEVFTLYRYPAIAEDVVALIRHFTTYVTQKGLRPLLEARAQSGAVL